MAGGLKVEKLSHIIVEKHISKYCFLLEASFEDPKLSVVDTIVINFSYTALSCHWLNFPSTNQTLRVSGALMRVCETYRLFSPRVWCGLTIFVNFHVNVSFCVCELRSLINQIVAVKNDVMSLLFCPRISKSGRPIVAIGVRTYSSISSI